MPSPATTPRNVHQFEPFVMALGFCFMGIGLALQPFGSLIEGLLRINTGTTGLIHDFVAIGGVGAALVNCGLVLLLEIVYCRVLHIAVIGPLMASMLMTAGFAFYGTNPVNALPLMAGVALYTKMSRKPPAETAAAALLSTALGPLVSLMGFDNNGWSPLMHTLAAILAGLCSGLVFAPLAAHFSLLNRGFSLYNGGFTAGMLALPWVSMLRYAGLQVEAVSILYEGVDTPLWVLAITLSVLLLVYGLVSTRGRLPGGRALLQESGRVPTDLVQRYGKGTSLFNMGVMGLVALAYIAFVGGRMNGPVLGGVLGVIAFAAYGKHPLNCLPVMLGCSLMQWICKGSVQSSGAMMAVLYGTALAPIAGEYGPGAGLLMGALHAAVVVNIFPVNGGINLYNNGFSSGLIAGIFVPVGKAFLKKIPRNTKSSDPSL